MKLEKPKNSNYAAIVTQIHTTVALDGCDNVQAAIIMGNQVIVSKNVKIGDIGIYFPLECQLSHEFLSKNNLYRVHKNKPNLNADTTVKGGYFEENGRIRCAKFLGHKSEGFYIPKESLDSFLKVGDFLEIGDEFDTLNGVNICKKYIVKHTRTPGAPGSRNKNVKKYESKLVENQFKFHQDTSMLYKNLHKINPDSLISITYKLHGTSGISSYILCRKPLNWIDRIARFFGANIVEKEYDYIYSSRKVIKNEELNPNAQHYYSEDIWGIAHKELKPFLQKGMTFYYEIVGFLPNGGSIQKDFDYGCEPGKHAIYIYRITQTNVDGKVFEFSAKQVQDFCKKNGLNAVPQLYYGYVWSFLYDEDWTHEKGTKDYEEIFLKDVKNMFNEKDCYMCKNRVPEEGCVIRIEGLDCEAYKQKSNRFYEKETKDLDKGVSNIEDEE